MMNPEPIPFMGGASGRRHLVVAEELRQRIVALALGHFLRLSTTLILTTAAPFSATSPEKSGRPVTRGGRCLRHRQRRRRRRGTRHIGIRRADVRQPR
jgi:hypothetical protein